MLYSQADLDAIIARSRPFGGRVAAPKVGDDSIGWRACRAIAARNIQYEKHWHSANMRQSVKSQGSCHKPGTPPQHLRSIDFSSLVIFGRPTVIAQKHFKALIKIKSGIWSEGR